MSPNPHPSVPATVAATRPCIARTSPPPSSMCHATPLGPPLLPPPSGVNWTTPLFSHFSGSQGDRHPPTAPFPSTVFKPCHRLPPPTTTLPTTLELQISCHPTGTVAATPRIPFPGEPHCRPISLHFLLTTALPYLSTCCRYQPLPPLSTGAPPPCQNAVVSPRTATSMSPCG
jgi:hypothetical protein